MAVISVNNESFETEVLKADKKVLVDLYADWCGPCKMMAPIVDKIAEENSEIKVCKINVDEAPEIAQKYDVMSIPTFLVFENGEKVASTMGYQTEERFKENLGL